MTKFEISLESPWPSYLRNWGEAHGARGRSWNDAIELFQSTTGGRMEWTPGAMVFELVFDDDAKAAWFLLEYS